MVKFVQHDNVSSSSSSPTHVEQPQGFTEYGRLPSRFRGIRTRGHGKRSIRNWSPAPRRIRNWNVADHDRTNSADEKGCFFFHFILIMSICLWNAVLVLEILSDANLFLYLIDDTPFGLDHVLISIVKCHACDFDIEVSLRRGCSEELDANSMVWPLGFQKFMFSRTYCYSVYVLIFVGFDFLFILWLIDDKLTMSLIDLNDCFAVSTSDLSCVRWKVRGGWDKDSAGFKLCNYAFGIFCLSWDLCTLIVT